MTAYSIHKKRQRKIDIAAEAADNPLRRSLSGIVVEHIYRCSPIPAGIRDSNKRIS